MTELRLDLLGRTLILPQGSLGLGAWLESQWHFPEHAGALESDWSFLLERSDTPFDPALLEDSRPLEGSFNPLAMRQDGLWAVWLLEHEGGVRISLESDEERSKGKRQVRLEWHGRLEHPDALYQGLCEAMRVSGLIPLHAAVAARAGGTGATAFLGPSGTGKTTTLLRAIHAGWTPLAEDFGWIDPHTLNYHSWDRALHLLPDTFERLQVLFPGVQSDPFNGRKFPVPFERLSGQRWVAPLEALTVLERDASRSSGWETLGGVQTLVGLLGSAGMPLISAMCQPFSSACGALIGRLECRKLVLGQGKLPL